MSGHSLLLFQTTLLVTISLSVLYPVVAYSRSVLHTEAIVTLAVSTLVFTAGSLVEQGLGNTVAAEGVYLLSAILFGVSIWLFAREFVRPGEASFSEDGPTPSSGSGFGALSDDAAEGGFAEAPDTEEPTEYGFADAPEGDDGE